MKKILVSTLALVFAFAPVLYGASLQADQKSCESGDAKGCYNLGYSYENGDGVKQDYSKAIQYYQKACNKGEATGCANLGILYSKGKG